MNTIRYIATGAVMAAAAIFISSCEMDNYAAPDSTLYGDVVDAETGELIPQALTSGSVIQLTQLDYDNPNTRSIRMKTDGTYENASVFKGKYFVHPTAGNFYDEGGDTIQIKGKTRYDVKVTPYIRIINDKITFNPEKGTVTATFSLKSDEIVNNIALICNKSPQLCWSIRSFTTQSALKRTVDETTEFSLIMNSQDIEENGDYYFRICALAGAAPTNQYNYSAPVKVSIDNSQIVPEPEPEGVFLDKCDSEDGWDSGVGTPAVSVDAKEGTASVEVSGNISGTVFFQKVFSDPVNTGVTRGNGILQMYLYINEPSLLTDGQLEITSSGGCDVNELHFSWKDMELHSGWNKLSLPLRNGSDAGLDLTKVNFIRMYQAGASGDVTIKIDGIQFISGTNVLFNCDSADGWGTSCSSGISVDKSDFKEGEGSLSASGSFSDVIFMRHLTDGTVNAGCDANGGITFWLYIGDVSVLPPASDHQIEVSSGPGDDTGEYGWRFTADDWSNLHSGWNKITLPIAKADAQGKPDPYKIDWFRIYMVGLKGETTFKIDDIEAY